MTLRTNAPHPKRRWSALLIVLALALGLFTTTVLANHVTVADAPSFNFVHDVDGADDEPGQKDLNSHASATDADGFWVTFKWDVTSLKGNNTADGCSLFDTSSPYNGLVDAAVCVTTEKNPLTFKSLAIYTCADLRDDRCAQPDLVDGPYGTECFIVNGASDFFHPTQTDTQSICLVDLDDIDSSVTPKLVNTCSYPSQEPNSDPSDCVVKISVSTGVATLSSGTTTWSATLNDTATLTPSDATGTVTFELFSDVGCLTSVWKSNAVNVASGSASTVGAGTFSGNRTITESTVDADGIYYWIASYTPTAGSDFVASASTCGEATTITPADVDGSAG
jgi:hypothetical protein